jgi:hypothetical protein
MLHMLLLIVSFVAFLFATFGVNAPRINLLALGLACWVLSSLVP